MNGLERYSFETLIYVPKNTFYVPAPKISDTNYSIWTLGWLDPKQSYFYETNYLSEEPANRINNFDEFLDFLQIVLDKKIYCNLFKEFDFSKVMYEILSVSITAVLGLPSSQYENAPLTPPKKEYKSLLFCRKSGDKKRDISAFFKINSKSA